MRYLILVQPVISMMYCLSSFWNSYFGEISQAAVVNVSPSCFSLSVCQMLTRPRFQDVKYSLLSYCVYGRLPLLLIAFKNIEFALYRTLFLSNISSRYLHRLLIPRYIQFNLAVILRVLNVAFLQLIFALYFHNRCIQLSSCWSIFF